MSVNSELAAAARKIAAMNARLPERHRLDIAPAWRQLLAHVEGCPDYKARRVIAEWTEIYAARISGRLLHAPLDEGGR